MDTVRVYNLTDVAGPGQAAAGGPKVVKIFGQPLAPGGETLVEAARLAGDKKVKGLFDSQVLAANKVPSWYQMSKRRTASGRRRVTAPLRDRQTAKAEVPVTPEPVETPEPEPESLDYASMTKKQLIQLCEELELDTSGSKTELLERVEQNAGEG